MAIHFTSTVADDTLLVTATGYDESLEQVQQYGLAIIEACRQGGVTCVLCNEVDLEYRLNIIDTFRAAEFIAAQAPQVARVAIVCNPNQLDDTKFFEAVAVNRGLTVRLFNDLQVAAQWLRGSQA